MIGSYAVNSSMGAMVRLIWRVWLAAKRYGHPCRRWYWVWSWVEWPRSTLRRATMMFGPTAIPANRERDLP